MDTLPEDLCTFITISRLILLRTRTVSDKFVEKIKTHIFVQQLFFENRALYEMAWKNVVKPNRRQMIVWRMHIACWITTTTDTHSECVIFIAFPRQTRLHKSAPMLCYTYNACIVLSCSFTNKRQSILCTGQPWSEQWFTGRPDLAGKTADSSPQKGPRACLQYLPTMIRVTPT